jgi:hypothetical protein
VGTSAKPFVVNLFDSTTITTWTEPSGYFALEAAGVVETIVEVGEVYGWMTAALRSSPTEKLTTITTITPILEISAETNGKSFQADFGQKQLDGSLRCVGQCWQQTCQRYGWPYGLKASLINIGIQPAGRRPRKTGIQPAGGVAKAVFGRVGRILLHIEIGGR